MGRLLQFLSLLVALALGFSIGAGYSWLKGQTNPSNPAHPINSTKLINPRDLIPTDLMDLISPEKPQKPSVEFKIIGVIDILPELRSHLKESDNLTIVVTEPSNPTPIAVKKILPVNFPFFYTIGKEDLVIKGRSSSFVPPQQVSLTARVGNLVGRPTEDPFSLPARGLHVLIDRVADDDRVVK